VADRKNQPNACDSLFGAWRASGKQDPLAYLERIRLAMKAGNTRLVTTLAGQMPPITRRSPRRLSRWLTIPTAS
jgi:hypothetical protein